MNKFCGFYIAYVYEYIIKKIEEDGNISFDIEESSNIKKIIEEEIFKRCFKSLLYCLNMERVDKNLEGNTPENRYSYFSDSKYCISAMNKIFPLMREQLFKEMYGKCKYILCVVNLFKSEQDVICKHFFNGYPEKIDEIFNSGDWHNDQCVLTTIEEHFLSRTMP